jgi:hypothetical protein
MSRRWWVVPLGVVAGAALGVAARAWMRLISDEPDFSWSGTNFIIGAFAVFGGAQGAARLLRRSRRRWLVSVGRTLGAVGLLPLFIGAGGIMFPTVIAGGFAVNRPTMRSWLRGVVAAVAALPVALVSRGIVDDFGWSFRAAAGVVALVAVYLAVVLLARPTFAANPVGLRVPRWAVAVGALGAAALMVALTAGIVFTG